MGWLFFSYLHVSVDSKRGCRDLLIWAEPWPPKETTLESAVLPRCRSWVFLLKTVINQIGLGCQSMPGTPIDKDDCSTKWKDTFFSLLEGGRDGLLSFFPTTHGLSFSPPVIPSPLAWRVWPLHGVYSCLGCRRRLRVWWFPPGHKAWMLPAWAALTNKAACGAQLEEGASKLSSNPNHLGVFKTQADQVTPHSTESEWMSGDGGQTPYRHTSFYCASQTLLFFSPFTD